MLWRMRERGIPVVVCYTQPADEGIGRTAVKLNVVFRMSLWTMQRVQVKSGTLASVGYDYSSSVLELEFRGGGVYQYHGVPEQIFQALMDAPSKGAFFNENISKVYQYIRVV